MYYLRSYKYPIYPNKIQATWIDATFDGSRKVWNVILERVTKEYELYKKGEGPYPSISFYDLAKRVTVLRNEKGFDYLKKVSRRALSMSIHALNIALKNFVAGRTDYPKFKYKYGEQSFSLESNKRYGIACGHVRLEKIPGWIKICASRPLPERRKGCTVSRDSTGQYYISFLCEREGTKTHGTGIIGIDLGIKDLVVTSTGEKIPNPKKLIKSLSKLKRAQQSLARKKKGSKNRNKQRIIVAKIHKQVTNRRNNYLHHVSKYLINNNHVIGVETLRIANMLKNRKLSRSFSDAALGELIRQLSYKAEESEHVVIVKVDPFFPSTHICSNCGWKTEKMSLSTREWFCHICDSEHDRDINAANNIRNEAIRILVNEYGNLSVEELGGLTLTSSKQSKVVK